MKGPADEQDGTVFLVQVIPIFSYDPAKISRRAASDRDDAAGRAYIIGNEAAERFCFYGMKTVLVVFMTKFLLDRHGGLATMSQEEAKGYYHLFVAGVYFFPIFGAIVADAVWGKFRTIFYLSLVYCLGNFALAADQTRVGLLLGCC